MTYEPWFIRYSERFEEEIKSMELNGFVLDEKVLECYKTVLFRGNSKLYPEYKLVIVYPESFPSQPPNVYYDGSILPEHHHPLTKEICTFGFGGSRWSAKNDGKDALIESDSVFTINNEKLEQVNTQDEDISWVPEPSSDYYPYQERIAAFISPEIKSIIFELPEDEDVVARFRHKNIFGLNMLLTQLFYNGKTINVEDPYKGFHSGGDEFNVKLVKVAKPLPWSTSKTEIDQFFKEHGLTLTKKIDGFLIVHPEDYLEKGKTRNNFVLIKRHRINGDYTFIRCMTFDDGDISSRMPELKGIQEKKVLIIGCGSIGSRIATELGRVGVEITVVDPDIHTLGSMLRHECGLNAVGDYKVAAIQERIYQLNPNLFNKIKANPFRVGSTIYPSEFNLKHIFNNYSLFVQQFYDSDLIIEATGSHGLRWYLNDLAFEYGKPVIFTWVTEGAWGGEAVRIIPGTTGCYLCWRHNRLSEAPSAPLIRKVFAPGCSQPTFTGSAFDIMEFSAKVVRMCIQTLLRYDEDLYPDSPDNHLVWSCRNSEGKIIMESKFFPVLQREVCPFCKK